MAETQYQTRLTDQVLADLRKRVGGTAIVTHQTTELQAGFLLGVNHVLNVLAEGYTVPTPKTNA